MELVAFLPLLLLVNSASSAETDNKTSIKSGSPSEDETDIHAVLRELVASVAEHKVKIQYLQRENQVQASKLRELESQKSEANGLKREQQAQGSKLKHLESQCAKVDKLTKDQQEQLGKLEELEKQKAEFAELKQQLKVTQVAFSASLVDSGGITIGPYGVYTPLIFRHVITNIGNAYSPNTGFFTAPVKGIYHFDFHIAAHGHSSYSMAVQLLKDGQHIVIASSHQTNGFASASNGVTLPLDVKEVVLLRLWVNSKLFDNTNRHTTFSGHLLFTV